MIPVRLVTAAALGALALSGCAPAGDDDSAWGDLRLVGRQEPTPYAVPLRDPLSAVTDPVAPRPVLRPKRETAPPAADPRGLPTASEYTRAARRVGAMSLPELAGQVIVASYDGTRAPVRLVRRLHLGGVIVFSDNVDSARQITRSNRTLAREVGRPLVVGVDQEGGTVARVLGEATRFPAFMSAGAADDADLTRAAARGSGAELLGMGFDLVFAPDADVTIGPSDPVIGSRSAGSRPGLVTRHVVAATQGYQDAGVVPVLKHFPGHGSLTTDSHLALPVQRRTRAQLDRVDLRPFREAVADGAPAVMTGHIDVRAVDPGRPASVSRKVTSGLLRRDLGFRGVVVTDSLAMDGVEKQLPGGRGAVAALRAGADVLLMPPDPTAARTAVVRAVRGGAVPRARLESAATRMLAMLLHQRAADAPPAAPGSQQRAATRLSRAAVTVVDGRCSGRLVTEGIRVVGPRAQAARMEAAARRAGLRVGSGSKVVLVPRGGAAARGRVVVALDTPYVLRRSIARSKIATYGDNAAVMRALVDVLLGNAPAPGHLPVTVRGVARTGC
ncbi:glycoside hydrolase family 3 protein [Nocardioides guangzhouensis]|nr:glycoside hydrolase family 3 N-terminal domain-containing protein [Nocardioides guangzhouensis]